MRSKKIAIFGLMLCVLVTLMGLMTTLTVHAQEPESEPEPESVSEGGLPGLLADAESLLPRPEDVTGLPSSEPDSMPDSEPPPAVQYAPVVTLAVSGSVYAGTISTTYLDYFKGFAANMPGVPYVVFRSDAYNYYMFYGEELRVSGYQFSGVGKYIRFYTQTGLVYRGTDSLNINAVNGFVYSNMSDDFPSFYEERGLLNEKVLIVCVAVLIGFMLVTRIFSRRS